MVHPDAWTPATWRMLTAEDLTPVDLRIFGVIDILTADGQKTTQEVIADAACVARSQVSISINRLRDNGFLSWETDHGAGNRYVTRPWKDNP